ENCPLSLHDALPIYNNGQSCCAVERIYVQKKIYSRFLEAYLNQLKKLKIGNPMEAGTEIGPLSRKEQLEVLKEQVRDAKRKGAKDRKSTRLNSSHVK